jgi:integrase
LEEAVPRLYIEKTKFDRSRWVVLHPSATQKLQLYSQRRRDFGFENNEAFFLNLKGKQVEGRNLRHAFEKLLKSAAITCSQGARAPSLHSFRHTFAVDRLKHWYEQNADIRNLLPHLSVYMGHVDLEGTYWYLTATPELMVSAGQLFEHYAKGEQNELQK